jgi:hypothetical protein
MCLEWDCNEQPPPGWGLCDKCFTKVVTEIFNNAKKTEVAKKEESNANGTRTKCEV